MLPPSLGKAPFYEELIPKARLTKFNLQQKLIVALLIIGWVVFFGMTVGRYSWGIHLIGAAGLVVCFVAFIKLFESPSWIRVYDTELTFEQKTVFMSLKKEDIQFFAQATLTMVRNTYQIGKYTRTPYALFIRGSKEKRVECEVVPYYIPFYVPSGHAKGVLVIATTRKHPTFIPTTRPTELLAALEKLTRS